MESWVEGKNPTYTYSWGDEALEFSLMNYCVKTTINRFDVIFQAIVTKQSIQIPLFRAEINQRFNHILI